MNTTLEELLQVMVLMIFLKHNLTWVAVENLLFLLKMVCQSEIIPTSKYLFLKFFKHLYKHIFHYFCPHCKLYLGILKNINNVLCPVCDLYINLQKTESFVIYIPIADQVKTILDFEEKNIMRFKDGPDGIIRDIFDGKLYKKIAKTPDGEELITLTV